MTFEEEFEKRDQRKKDGIEFLVYIAVLVLISFLVVTFIGQRTVVSGASMNNTLYDKDNLIIDKISYKFHDPKRFDVVVFPDPADKKTYFIKRIIGLPGEEVYIDPYGKIYINGALLEENYGKDTIIDPGRAANGVVLGKDEYFVMGDNRNNSLDSRFDEVGNIHKKDFVGRAWLKIYPFSDAKSLIPKESKK
ncbi:MAG: signal peptidase I [Lachnospiraceae bacterium]|nr:signal peptidase I [Lachnospiraceae bacterium]